MVNIPCVDQLGTYLVEGGNASKSHSALQLVSHNYKTYLLVSTTQKRDDGSLTVEQMLHALLAIAGRKEHTSPHTNSRSS